MKYLFFKPLYTKREREKEKEIAFVRVTEKKRLKYNKI